MAGARRAVNEYVLAFAVGSIVGLALGSLGLFALILIRWRWLW